MLNAFCSNHVGKWSVGLHVNLSHMSLFVFTHLGNAIVYQSLKWSLLSVRRVQNSPYPWALPLILLCWRTAWYGDFTAKTVAIKVIARANKVKRFILCPCTRTPQPRCVQQGPALNTETPALWVGLHGTSNTTLSFESKFDKALMIIVKVIFLEHFKHYTSISSSNVHKIIQCKIKQNYT